MFVGGNVCISFFKCFSNIGIDRSSVDDKSDADCFNMPETDSEATEEKVLLISILSGDLQTPKLDYYINEKANAIAPKITGTGAAAIQEQINSTFSSVASESVSGILKQSASDLSSTLGSVNSDITKTLEKDEAVDFARVIRGADFSAAALKFSRNCL